MHGGNFVRAIVRRKAIRTGWGYDVEHGALMAYVSLCMD